MPVPTDKATHPAPGNLQPPAGAMRRFSGQQIFLAVVVLGSCVLVAFVLISRPFDLKAEAQAQTSRLTLEDIPFNGRRAFGYLEEICDIGPRISGSEGMRRQQELLAKHFRDLGGEVEFQRFQVRHPLNGQAVPMANLIVRWHPERKDRILLCAHYDTRPYPDRDPRRPRGTFIGANDGGSGTALLMEMAHEMADFDSRYGVDFVLFDAEEFCFFNDNRDRYFIGSEYFSRNYAAEPPEYRYRYGILLDMVGDADLQLFYESNSVSWPETRAMVHDIWKTARRLGVREFVPRKEHEVRDDHLKLQLIGKIPTCDIIDFDYPYWHTEGDTPERCSALSLAKVGWVVHEWIKNAP